MASESSSNPPSIASTADAVDRQIKVFELPANAAAPVEMPESFYKLDSSELKKLYQSQMEQRQKLENSPLKTQKMRNAEEQERMKKYPKTTMRIRFPDRRILQATFLSKEPVAALYDFVRSTLQTPQRPFLLCLPPRTKLVDPDISLFKANLSPASNVMFVWLEKLPSGQQESPILLQQYLDMQQELPSPTLSSDSSPTKTAASASSTSSGHILSSSAGNKQGGVPKWLQKGLFKKK